MDTTLNGPSRPPLSCGKPKYLVVLLHGAGSNGDEIIDLSLDWAPTLNKAEFLAPNAPWRVDIAGNGRQWAGPPPGDGVEEAVERLQAFLDDVLAERRLKDSQLALVGFAQGAAVAVRAGLARSQPVAAIVAAGRGIEEYPGAGGDLRSTPPVLLVEADIGPGAAGLAEAERQLRDCKIQVKKLVHPGDYYGLDDEGVGMVADYLHQALVTPGPD
ncbi:alpha/beta hydrolase [Methylococcus mesophilus]|uniref:alpha/beta hydrolase n=1 Tax=Methylococcus mesophilus TaxID=2993564 RepID=UPI00224B04B9|nr:alpha/beta fold hydrolase [Methylococcus mesophilus]UZR28949.1 alpha/beta fold hydrolase [Methylococcus mesophilus]